MSSSTKNNEIVKEVTSLEQIQSNEKKKAVLFFWAVWHEATAPSGSTSFLYHTLATSAPSISFYRVEAEAHPEISSQYNVNVVPTFVLLHGDVIVNKIVGADDVAKLTQAVSSLRQREDITDPSSLSTGSMEHLNSNHTSKLSEEEKLHQKLKSLIHKSTVMLFMKGTPNQPKCGFSRQAVEILQQANIPFGAFDILTDEEVRQGLKTFSDWPTYPQCYVRGELVGGLDILKEMREEGSLKKQLGIETTLLDNALDTPTTAVVEESLEDRLSKLVNRSKVMLFMKGLPSMPRCGFSRKICEILNELGVEYDAFDILGNEEVRQGLKTFSDWPTYPQLYIDGDLIGGLDIVKEMAESGELQDLL